MCVYYRDEGRMRDETTCVIYIVSGGGGVRGCEKKGRESMEGIMISERGRG